MNSSIFSLGFYFKLYFEEIDSPDSESATFQEVSGISIKLDVEEVVEGGENRFTHRIPTHISNNDLVLKRGLTVKNSKLSNWIEKTMTDGLNSSIQPKDINVQLLDLEGNALSTWSFINAYPTKWKPSELNTRTNEIIIEHLAFQYSYFVRK